MTTLLRRPSAVIPLAMSVTALALVTIYVSVFGVARETDEGAVAHLWQLLIVGQTPIVAFFLFQWLPRALRAPFSLCWPCRPWLSQWRLRRSMLSICKRN